MKLRHLRVLVLCTLMALVLCAYSRTLTNGFINYDDDKYVTQNEMVAGGLTFSSLVDAFKSTKAANWHPLTWISHMLDVQLFGLRPAGHHLMSLLLHAANAVLLFLVFYKLTGAVLRSGFIACLFALHPLHVQAVAWVAERKEVLSTFFGLLAIWAYVWYSHLGRTELKLRRIAYLCVIGFFALGLMAKPMLVTIPFVLLLIDYWPLRRMSGGSPNAGYAKGPIIWRLIAEKIPLFILSAMSCGITYFVQQRGDAMLASDRLPFDARLGNAVVSYMAYILKALWPRDLAIFYPHPVYQPAWILVGSCLALLVLTLMFFRMRRSFPHLIVGWLWYLGMLVPVIGLVQVGSQAMADRYTYFPLIGLFIMVAWTLPEPNHGGCLRRCVWLSDVRYSAAMVSVLAFSICTWIQLTYWKDTASIFRRALAVTTSNAVAHDMLAIEMDRRGQIDEAIRHYERALQIKPDYVKAHNNLAIALFQKGDYSGAWRHVELCKQYGGSPHPDFIRALRQHMR